MHRADIVLILSTVVSMQPLLRNGGGFSSQCSPETTLIHRSCSKLLNVLAVGACPLTDLEDVLSQLPPPVVKEEEDREAKSEEHGCKRVLNEAMKDSSCLWITVLEEHQPMLTEIMTRQGTSLFGQKQGVPLHVAASATGIVWFPFMSKSSCRGGRLTTDTGPARSVAQPNISITLLQVRSRY